MGIGIRQLTPTIGAEIEGIDFARALSAEELEQARRAWLQHTILLFRHQPEATPDQIIAFSRQFGQLDDHDQVQYTLPDHPKIAIVSNVKRNGRYIGAPKAGRNWHSDSQYLNVPPSGSFLFAKQVPPHGGKTLFANMYAAYDALPEETKRKIDGLKVNHSRVRAYPISHPERPPLSEEEKAKLPDVVHPLVRTHPETGRKALYVGGVQHGGTIVGMDPETGDALLRELRAFATRPRFVYSHHWEAGDAILWDNRCTMHCATPFEEDKYDRIMYRAQMVGDVPF